MTMMVTCRGWGIWWVWHVRGSMAHGWFMILVVMEVKLIVISDDIILGIVVMVELFLSAMAMIK